MFNRPEASNVQVTPQFTSPQQGSFNLSVSGAADISTMFWRLMGQEQVHITRHRRGDLGHQEAQSRARTRQYRVDGIERQDDGAQRGRPQSLDHTQERRKDAGRHQGLDRSVRHRRQCRHQQRQRHLDRLDRLGGRQRHLQQFTAIRRKAAASRTTRSGRTPTTTPGTAASTTATRTTTCSTPRRAGAQRRTIARTRRRPARPR